MPKDYNHEREYFFKSRNMPATFDRFVESVKKSLEKDFPGFDFDNFKTWHGGWSSLENCYYKPDDDPLKKHWATFVLKDLSDFLWVREAGGFFASPDKKFEKKINDKVDAWLSKFK